MLSFILFQGSGLGSLGQFLPFLLIIVVFYFFMIRPNARRMKEQKNFILNLKKGDHVVTNGGIHGTIHDLQEQQVVLKVDKSVNITIEKNSVSAQASKVLNQQNTIQRN